MDISVLSLILLALGVTGLVGTYLVGWFLKASPYGDLVAIPWGMAAIAMALVALGQPPVATTALLAG